MRKRWQPRTKNLMSFHDTVMFKASFRFLQARSLARIHPDLSDHNHLVRVKESFSSIAGRNSSRISPVRVLLLLPASQEDGDNSMDGLQETPHKAGQSRDSS